MRAAFAVWITGLPAAGKSALAAALVEELAGMGITPAVLESDALRPILTPCPRYDEAERDAFYEGMASLGRLLTSQGIPVIFDATASRRRYRNRARLLIPRFIEVYVATPLGTCIARDPKGIYRLGRAGNSATVPGLQAPYEAPTHAEVIVQGHQGLAASAGLIIDRLGAFGYLAG